MCSLRGSWSPKSLRSSNCNSSKMRSPRDADRKSHRSHWRRGSSLSGPSRSMERSYRHREAKTWHPSSEVIRPINNRYEQSLDYPTYQMMYKPSEYDRIFTKNIVNWAKRWQALMPCNIFDAFDLILVVCYLPAFKLACHWMRSTKEPQCAC